MAPHLLRGVWGVDEQRGPRRGGLEDIDVVEQLELMASHEGGLVGADQVRRNDRARAESQVGDRP